MVKADWIALDWGTTHLRGWAMSDDGDVLAEATSDQGMGALTPSEYEPALLQLTRDWDCHGPMIACGMVGSRQGWIEAPYATVPAPALGIDTVSAPTKTPGLVVRVIPGLQQTAPADVMRGEETQIAGFLRLHPGWEGVLCLPGTHTKWALIRAGRVVSFQTFMTGDLFAAIAGHTVLRHSLSDAETQGGSAEPWEDAAFEAALAEVVANPAQLAALFFKLRAEGLVHSLAPAAARARLSGLLIGSEIVAAQPIWQGNTIGVIGAGSLSALYIKALAAQGKSATQADATAVTIAGLTAARTTLKETA